MEVRLAGQDQPIANAHRRETDAYAVRNVRSGCGRLSEIVVSRLSKPREEVQTIASFFPDAFEGESVSMYIGLNATEEAVKTLARGKRVIHVATHGYYIQGDCEPKGEGQTFFGENPYSAIRIITRGCKPHGKGAEEANERMAF
ncbi:MAG: CHAT domain-containing protein [Ignavibacteria bacterium]|nr:CHAT domain-containing protein [Ignavibacteria bacterium]